MTLIESPADLPIRNESVSSWQFLCYQRYHFDAGGIAFCLVMNSPNYGEAYITTKPDGAGMGIGLHLTNEIMNSLHGKLLFPEPDDFDIPNEFKKGAIVGLAFKKEK